MDDTRHSSHLTNILTINQTNQTHYNNNINNNNTDDFIFENELPIVFWCFLSVETFIIIFANLMLCWLFLVNRKLRSQQNYFVLSLSISDLLVGLCITPCEYCALQKQIESVQCPLFCGSVLSFNMLASVMNLVLIAMDRYFSIRMPFRYQEILSKRRAIIIICIAWLITLTITVLPLSWALNTALTQTKQIEINIIFAQTIFGFVFLLGFLLLVIYYAIIKTIREKLRSVREKTSNTGIKVCILVAISFFICWIPTAIVEILNQNQMILPQGIGNATYFIMLINPCLDPILYAYYRTDFRNELATWRRRQWKSLKRLYNRLLYNKSDSNNNFFGLQTLVTHSVRTGACNVVVHEETQILNGASEDLENIVEKVSVL